MWRGFWNWLLAREEINGNACPTYMYRWRLCNVYLFKVYLHHFVANDWTRDLHDHPKRFISIGLKGRYIEETPRGDQLFVAPWLRTFPATHIHRIRATNCWTVVIVFRPVREWGFWNDGKWIQWEQYVDTAAARARKDC